MFLIIKTISEGSEGKSTFKVSHSVRVFGDIWAYRTKESCVVKISLICHASLLLDGLRFALFECLYLRQTENNVVLLWCLTDLRAPDSISTVTYLVF